MALTFGKTSFPVVRGLTWAETLTIRDSAGNPQDLTGASFAMRVRDEIANDAFILELNDTNGRLTSPTPAAGLITLLVSADDTLNFPENDHELAVYVYDMVIIRTGPPEVREPVVGGRVVVSPQVTRPWT